MFKVSVVVFKICDIEVGLQTVDKDMVAKVMVESLKSEDRGNMNYDEFQAQQLTGRFYSIVLYSLLGSRHIQSCYLAFLPIFI